MTAAQPELPILALEGALRGALILFAGYATAVLIRDASAAVVDVLWKTVFCSLLVLPPAALFLPAWNVPIDRPGWTLSISPPPIVSLPSLSAGPAAGSDRLSDDGPAPRDGEASRPRNSIAPIVESGRAPVPASTGELLTIVWLGGVLALLASMAARHRHAARLRRSGRSISDHGWSEDLRWASDRVGLGGRVDVRRSDRVAVPVALRNCVLVPDDALAWDSSRRRIVLLHELAHLRRSDPPMTLIVELACAVHWCNPLVWLARRRAAVVRERACDDVVIRAGIDHHAYAGELVAFGRRLLRNRVGAATALSTARSSTLERRLNALLDSETRRSAPGGFTRIGVMLILLAVLLPLTFLQFASPSDRPSTDDVVDRQASLVDALNDSSAEVRSQAVWALGELGQTTAAPALLPLLEDVDSAVRTQTAWAVGELRIESSIPRLVEMLADSVAAVREQAAWALGELGAVAARGSLAGLVERDPDSDVRRQAAWALGELGE